MYDEQAAEDIAAEALIKLWEKLKSDIINSPQAVTTILKNKSLDYLRLEQTDWTRCPNWANFVSVNWHSCIQSGSFATHRRFSAEVNKIIQATYAHFWNRPAGYLRRRFENKMNKEIAEELHITVKVEYHISKALKEFRVSLKLSTSFYFFFYFH